MQGKTINGFELKHPLGVGGMAEVWYAENRIGKKAAVKLLLPILCKDENVVTRFLTEAKVMVDLNHPNIRQVHDYGELDGRPTIIMEYLEGEDLKARLKRGQRFTDEEVKHWWNQLVDALNYTHKKGIIHRDIKPGNIFVDTEGNVKLLDFGIAKVRDSISTTQTGQKLGTLMYMSPEQVKDSKHIDYHTDIYSLAVTFVHLISGKKPYNSDTTSDFEISEQIVYKSLDVSGLPLWWRSFLTPYLEKESQKRPELKKIETKKLIASPQEDGDEGTIVEGTTNSAETPTDSSKSFGTSIKPKGKKRVWIVIIVVVLLGIMGCLVVFNSQKQKRQQELEEALCAIKENEMYDNCTTIEGCDNYLEAYPFGRYVVEVKDKKVELLKAQGYVDLGLPSGTLWKNKNENGYFDYEEAIQLYGNTLPTKVQMDELINNCKWTFSGWNKSDPEYYKVTGPNGNTIVLPNEGNISIYDSKNYGYGQVGTYWSCSCDEAGKPYVLSVYRNSLSNDQLEKDNEIEATSSFYFNRFKVSVRLVNTIIP